VELVISYAGGESGPAEVMLVVERVDKPEWGSGRHPHPAPAKSQVGADPGSVWKYRAEAPGYWSPEKVFVVQDGLTVELVLYPTGTLSGKLTVPHGETMPAEISARFQSSAGSKTSPRIPESTVQCSVKEGEFACEVPAGKLDLRLRAKGFISHYRWGVEVPRRKTLAMGTLALEPGGSVVGRVEAADRGASPEGARVEVLPLQPNPPLPAEERRQNLLRLSAQADARGFFHVTGVPPGMYRVEARKEGIGEASHQPAQVMPNAETEVLDPLVLRRPATVEISVVPRVDPLGRPWKIDLMETSATGGGMRPVANGVLGKDGAWRKAGIPQGRYRLTVQAADGSQWLVDEVEVRSEHESIEHTLDMVAVDGTLTLAGEPLAANVWFGGRSGVQRIKMLADEEGRFTGTLPRAGEWRVDVESEHPRFFRPLSAVTVSPEGRVEIDLPNGSLKGEVLDADGKKLPSAALVLFQVGEMAPLQARADAEGSFSFLGLAPGSYQIQAFTGDGAQSTGPQELQLSASDKEPPFVSLRMRAKRLLNGRVVSAHGPVPGAMLSAVPRAGGKDANLLIPQAQTDVEGGFQMNLPEGVEEVDLTVMPPGFAMKSVRLRPQGDAAVTIPVQDAGGTLAIKTSGDANDPMALLTLQVRLNGVEMSSGSLRTWAGLHRVEPEAGLLRIPNLELGVYSICQGPPDRARCSEGVLSAAQGELVLTVPAP
jgi:hypothetical protein